MRLPVSFNGELQSRQTQGEAVARQGASLLRTVTRSLHKRVDCNDKKYAGTPECEKPTSTQTAPIVLGAVIPLLIACGILYFLHRRSKKRQALEDANDPHKSLDFGVDMPSQPGKAKKKGGKGVPEMTITEVGMDGRGRNARGLSMDMGVDSPYLLPAQLQGSRESLHSMSRTVQDQHDPYRPVNMMRTSHETSRSPRPWADNGSVYSASTVRTADNSSLLANAQRMSQSHALPPKRGDSMNSDETSTRQMHSARSMTPTRKTSQTSSEQTLANISETAPPKMASPPPLPPPPKDYTPEPAQQAPPPRKSSMPSSAMPPRKSSMSAASQPPASRPMSETSYYGQELPPPPPPPKIEEPSMVGAPVVQEPEDYDQYDIDPTAIYTGRFSIDNSAPSQQLYPVQNNRVSVMGLRPLPPDDPQENAEQRANRIRSFYKEYFDDSRPGPAQGGYYEDSDYYMDGAIYDPDTGNFITPGQAPFAQPMGRRAMTPPPRAGPRFAGAETHRRQYSTMSAGRAGPRGRAPSMPKKKLPPPKALTSLPTPHMLREDTALIMNPIDFAPPTTFREHQNGRRPDSPMGIQRPYSPSVKAYSPLVPAFDDLTAMPSPHHLRKSGAFMPLDFAPPSKLRVPGEGTASDAGSIRSARSGISAMQMDAVRAGAYRVSRIPKEFVTSRDDLSHQLRPKMDLISRA